MRAPRKRFGQHFLSDQAIVQRIVDALAPQRGQHLIEIGPGQGALTMPVLKRTGQLEVVEIDRDLIPEIEARHREGGNLTIHEADAMTFDYASLKQDERFLRVFGNLPYNISTPLLFHLLDYADIISDMLFMLQKEVAMRIASPAGDDDYGRLSVMAQYRCEAECLFDVPPGAFYPPPKVQSTIIRITPYKTLPYQAKDFKLFDTIVRQAFGQRRKTIRNSLKGIVDDAAWSNLSIRSDVRAETLTVKDFVEISNAIA